MRGNLLLVFIIFVVGLSLMSLWVAPNIFYHSIVEYHLKVPWFNVGRIIDAAKEPFVYKREMRIENKALKDLNKNFHIQNFILPLPIRNPLFTFSPILSDEDKDKKLEIGVEYLNQSLDSLGKIKFLNAKDFLFLQSDQPLFDIPWVRAVLREVPFSDLWQDLFSKKNLEGVDFNFFDAKNFNGEKWRELIYNLYIIHLRDRLFPPNVQSVKFYSDMQMGILELKSDSNNWKSEQLLIMEDGQMERFKLETLINDEIAQDLRRFILKNVEFKYANKQEYFEIMKEFQNLSAESRRDTEGFCYLFAAWSQDVENGEFLKRIVTFLEKNPGNKLQINRLYEYAFSRYGEKFNLDRQEGELGTAQFLEHNIEEEEKKSFQKKVEKKVEVLQEEEFKTDQDRVDFYLKKAQEKGVNTSDESLISD